MRTLKIPFFLLAVFVFCGSTCENYCENEQEYVVLEFFDKTDSSQIDFPYLPFARVFEKESGRNMPFETYYRDYSDPFDEPIHPGAYLLMLNPDRSELCYALQDSLGSMDSIRVRYSSDIVYQEEDCGGVVFSFEDIFISSHSFDSLEYFAPGELDVLYQKEAARVRVWL